MLNNWENRILDDLRRYAKEFTITTDGLILKNNMIFIPERLRKKVMAIAHECHQGFIKTKSPLKEKVWFPDMDQSVKELLLNCIPGLAAGSDPPVEPIKMTSMPEPTWEELHLDFKGPLSGGGGGGGGGGICWS